MTPLLTSESKVLGSFQRGIGGNELYLNQRLTPVLNDVGHKPSHPIQLQRPRMYSNRLSHPLANNIFTTCPGWR